METNIDPSNYSVVKNQSVRLLPGIIIVIIQWLMRFVIPWIFPGDGVLMAGVITSVLGLVAIMVWWIFFSKAPVNERWIAIVLMIGSLLVSSRFLDKSISTGNMGLMFIFISAPLMSLCFVVWAVVRNRLSKQLRLAALVFTILSASGIWLLIRSDGMSGHLDYDFKWRWAKTQEEKFTFQEPDKPELSSVAAETGAGWPGFRGLNRNGIVQGLVIKTDWKISPPAELWRRNIGAGCSSFAVSGGLIYTQEQRGEEEAVTCYQSATGNPVWVHKDKARFWDSHAGAGPRGTPTLNNGNLFTLGATGIVNAINASDGSILWSHNAAKDTGGKDSGWGYTSSPLVTDSLVIVAASGTLAAYDRYSGELRWSRSDSCKSYSSPQLLTIAGIPQIVMISSAGAQSYSQAHGELLWAYSWPTSDRILQPAQTDNGDILICSATAGVRLISVNRTGDTYGVKEKWTSQGIRPYFNDIVIHKGYAYGFDGLAIGCINLDNGKRMWRGGRYGGQILLLADQDLLIVVTEKGDLALVSATPESFRELAHIKAIHGKTWNHPAVDGSILLVRNSEEMAAFRLPLKL